MTPDLKAVPNSPPDRSYDELVKRGRAAREQADNVQWTEGDLALEVEHLPATARPRDPDTGAFLATDEHALKRYADDIDVPFNTLRRYRSTAEAWPRDVRRARVSFSVHQELAAQPDRFELIRDGLSRREARAIVRARTSATSRKPGWFELAGIVGDDLIAAEKHLRTFEAAIGRQPNKDLAAKLERYARIARDIADRLDSVREWREESAA